MRQRQRITEEDIKRTLHRLERAASNGRGITLQPVEVRRLVLALYAAETRLQEEAT